ncbi:ATP-binding protein [Kribbella sp. NPDC003505]|uniref:AlbA family DNA-binding domain-containing protein n=1 Tax=Kribbella sp. NPDC003505 TaxID=3154448 RepID=UPI0033BE48B1
MTDDALIVEPVVTAEKLASLLAVGCELRSLDFKQTVDLDEHAELVEFAKDVAAFRSCGGYLVIGADDQGRPTGTLSGSLATKFDEANLRQKLEKFLRPTDVISALHELDGHRLVLVYVPRHPLGFTVVKSVGEYTKPGGGQKVVLRPGDVFVRRGTSSERWTEADVEGLFSPRDARLREAHRMEFAAMVAAIQQGAQGQAIAGGPAQSLVWQLDQASFDGAVVEFIRRNDIVPIQLFLIRMPGEAQAAAARGDQDKFDTMLDRTISLGAVALTLGREELTGEVIECLTAIYQNPPEVGAGEENPLPRAIFWVDILARVEALGALAVVLKKWTVVRALAAQPAPDTWYSSWLRHGLTEAARSNVFPTTAAGHQEQGGLIPLARRVAHRLPALRPYVADDSGYDPEPGASIPPTDPILDALCAFDALAALVVMTGLDPAKFDVHQFYPSFGNYYSRRSIPYWARLLKDAEMREALLSGVGDDTLGRAMAGVAEVAQTVLPGRWGLWDISDETVSSFIRDWRVREANRQGG